MLLNKLQDENKELFLRLEMLLVNIVTVKEDWLNSIVEKWGFNLLNMIKLLLLRK